MRSDSETHSPATVDFADIKFAVVMVVVGLTLFFTKNFVPDAGLNRYVTDIIASFCCVAYILHRARRHPEKLDEWGLTTRLSPTGRIAGAGLVVLAFAGPATLAFILGGRLSFSLSMVVSGLGYVWSAFAQEFLLCSILANALARTRLFRGAWRVPAFAGVVFGLAHLLPEGFHWPHTPLMMGFTALVGFTVVFYFLRFRNLWPIVALHAIGFPMLTEWVDPVTRSLG